MKSLILRTASNYLLPVLLLFSVFLLIRGHYSPGGGFVGGLIASIAFVLHAFANTLQATKKLLKIAPERLIPIGLMLALASGLLPIALGEPFLTALWFDEPVPIIGLIGTPLFFDTGVFVVVVGITLSILFNISENII
jgi:multicomponent Na+:H+ antiporter subunit B